MCPEGSQFQQPILLDKTFLQGMTGMLERTKTHYCYRTFHLGMVWDSFVRQSDHNNNQVHRQDNPVISQRHVQACKCLWGNLRNSMNQARNKLQIRTQFLATCLRTGSNNPPRKVDRHHEYLDSTIHSSCCNSGCPMQSSLEQHLEKWSTSQGHLQCRLRQ